MGKAFEKILKNILDFGKEKHFEYDIKSFDYKNFDIFHYMKINSKRYLKLKTVTNFETVFTIHKINKELFQEIE